MNQDPSSSAHSLSGHSLQHQRKETDAASPRVNPITPVLDLSPQSIDALAAELASESSPQSQGSTHSTHRPKLPGKRHSSAYPAKPPPPPSSPPSSPPSPSRRPIPPHAEPWQVQKAALQRKFGVAGWAPRKRLSPDAVEGIRALHAQYPDTWTTPVLAERFEVSAEAMRRILKGKWRPSEAEAEARRARWDRRGETIWGRMVELGVKPPKRWREMGVGVGVGVGAGTARDGEEAKEDGDRRGGRGRAVARGDEWSHDVDANVDRAETGRRPGQARESLAERIL